MLHIHWVLSVLTLLCVYIRSSPCKDHEAVIVNTALRIGGAMAQIG